MLSAYRAAGDGAGRLAVLGRRATTAGGTVPLPAHAALVGLVASLAQERPELRPLLLDLEGDVPPAVPASGDHAVLAFRDGKLFAPQLLSRPLTANPSEPFSLARASSNTLDDLRWAPAVRRTPGASEVEIEIATAGINFRDVMNLLGVYPGDGGAAGVECAGTVTAVGRGVTGVTPGDTVIAIAPACFASHVIADAQPGVPHPAIARLAPCRGAAGGVAHRASGSRRGRASAEGPAHPDPCGDRWRRPRRGGAGQGARRR